MKELVNIATCVIASDNININSAADIDTNIVSSLGDEKLDEISLNRKNKAKTFATMRKSVQVGKTVVPMSSDQLSQRLLISAVQDEAPLLEIFSHELSGVAPSSFHNNREIRKNKKPELMNKANTILIDILMESAFHVTDGCTCLYCFYWAKVGNIKYLYSSFKQTLLNECGTNINQISILVKK